jgi:hypothetical protein
MTTYSNQSKDLPLLMRNPFFWTGLKRGDVILGRTVVREAKDTTCRWPQLTDLMSDEGTSWMVCRAGFDHPACGCPHTKGEEE